MDIQSTSSAIFITDRQPAARAPGRAGLLDRFRAWLRQRNDARIMRDVDPRIAVDADFAPACDPRPAAFVVDPRPLWGIGLTPEPATDVPPAWTGSRAGSREIAR